jgi:hypothetical protein
LIGSHSRFKGHTNFVVQDLMIRPHVVNFRCERWQTPERRLCLSSASSRSGINAPEC